MSDELTTETADDTTAATETTDATAAPADDTASKKKKAAAPAALIATTRLEWSTGVCEEGEPFTGPAESIDWLLERGLLRKEGA